MSKDLKVCAECRHIWAGVMCGRTKMTNTVTGEPFWTSCGDERKDSWRSRFFNANCGSAGRFWERKVRVACTAPQFRWETPPDAD